MKKTALAALMLIFAARLFAFMENYEIRERLLVPEKLLSATPGELSKLKPAQYRQSGQRHSVRVETRRENGSSYILFINEQDGQYPIWSEGSWSVRRSLKSGVFDQITVLYRAHPGTYVKIRPVDRGERAVMDVVLYGVEMHAGVPLGAAFDRLLTAPFGDVVEMSRGLVDWDLLLAEPSPPEYAASRAMVGAIRAALSGLPDAEDGAMDGQGRLVRIKDLAPVEKLGGFNCSGFAKWVVDGIFRQLGGRYLEIDELKAKHLERRAGRLAALYEDERDPYFGLDWSRNLALKLGGLGSPARPADETAFDVDELPHWRYQPDAGYSPADLPAILYYLAVKEPGHFYLGSVNRKAGDNPVLQQHIHLVALFPYFDEFGNFFVPVFERNVETGRRSEGVTGLGELRRRYSREGDLVHLVRLKADSRFKPPVFR